MIKKLTLCAVMACVAGLSPALAKDDPEPVRVMVLGTYHFSNPGLDLNNIESDNIFSDRRQSELEALAASLATFEPTVVAVERVAEPPYADPGWAEFDAEMLETTATERVQIGYRLADVAGVERVYAIDEVPSEGEPNYFPYEEVMTLAQETGREDDLAAISDMSALMQKFEAMQSESTISELLAYMNSDAFPDTFYWSIIGFGEGEAQPGAELAAYWFMRNAKIFNKLTQVTEPGDRVVIVYGSGHGHWLRQLVERTPGYELEPVQPYLTGQG